MLDWIDYRRTPNAWPLFAIPPMLAVAWAYGGWIGVGIIVAFALTVAFAVIGIAALAMVTWAVGNATVDVLAALSSKVAPGERAKNLSTLSVR